MHSGVTAQEIQQDKLRTEFIRDVISLCDSHPWISSHAVSESCYISALTGTAAVMTDSPLAAELSGSSLCSFPSAEYLIYKTISPDL